MAIAAPINGVTRNIGSHEAHIYETTAGGLHSFRAYLKKNAAIQAWGHTMDAAFDKLKEIMDEKGIF